MRIIALISYVLPLSGAMALPALSPRDAVSKDTIRYMKCAKLVNSNKHAANGDPWERGMAAHYADKDAQPGAPTRQVLFDMQAAKGDIFYDHDGPAYGGDDFFWGGGKIWSSFSSPVKIVDPPRGVWLGSASSTVGSDTFSFNCFTEGRDKPFKYEDQYYGTCTTYVTCLQADALQVDVLASKQNVHTRGSKLPKPADIYAKFSEAFKSDSSMCDPTAIELPRDSSDILGKSCTVSFECKSNDDAVDILKLLEISLSNFAKSDAYKETQEQEGDCIPTPAGMCIPNSAEYTFREMPAITSLSAKSIPPKGSGRYGAEVAHIRTTISCPEAETSSGICGVLNGLFALGTAIPLPGPAAGAVVGSVLVTTACAIAGQ